MVLIAGMLMRQRNLFVVVVLSGTYSLLLASVLVALDAPDVAMTEAAVGAGVSTVLLLGALHLCKIDEARPARRPWVPLSLCLVTGALLIYGALGLPELGDPQAPAHRHVVPRYLGDEIDIPNVVTAILASYRGYDTLGETVVVFTAGVGLLALLRGRERRGRTDAGDPTRSQR